MPILRHALVPVEALVYGVSYAFLQNIIRSPTPLDAEWTWNAVTKDMPRGTDWIRTTWPLKPLRPLVIRAKMKQDHVLGISAHYDVSNDFYKLFLDKKYMFYSCADFKP
ncbi:MAG: class I SAM-dependent methyltransferase, partial [Pirellulales bacterium]|nr:class I SAM-dependent methyltransferase [Pirellulales bacterium]